MSKYYSSSIAFGVNQTKTEKVVVSPTKIGDVTTDAVSGALTVDEVPTLNSLNPVSSDGVARAVIQAGAELPTRSSEDTGKVLTVANSDGDLEWDVPADGIPDMTGQDGKILGAVDNSGTMEAQWINPPDGLPSITENAGKVLKVNAGATGVEWANESTVTVDQNYNSSSANAQSGTAVAQAIASIPSSSYTAGDGIDITSGVVSADVDGTTIGIDSTTKKIKSLQVIPTKTSDLQNDSNFVVASSLATVATSGSYADLSNKPAIPTKTSDLQNDSNFVSSSSLATVATSGSYADLSNKPAIPSVDQTYNASSTNAQSGTAVAQAIAAIPAPSVDEVPAVTSSDDGKVLTAAYSGGTGSYSWQPASGGGSSYTAGDGIDITNNEISVDYDTDTLDTVYPKLTVNMAQSFSSGTLSIPDEIQALAAGSSPATVKIHVPANTLYLMGDWTANPLRIAFCASNYIKNDEEGDFAQFTSVAVSCTYESIDNYTWIDEQDIEITLPCNSLNGWSSSVTPVKFTISVDENDGNAYFGSLSIGAGTTLSNPVVFSYPNMSADQQLAVKNPVPASIQADSGKVLKVNASGNAEWGTDGFTTTAGVTDIQVVNALPASPVSTVLYLIPEN